MKKKIKKMYKYKNGTVKVYSKDAFDGAAPYKIEIVSKFGGITGSITLDVSEKKNRDDAFKEVNRVSAYQCAKDMFKEVISKDI